MYISISSLPYWVLELFKTLNLVTVRPWLEYGNSYPYLVSSSTGNGSHSNIYSRTSFFISSSTSNHIRSEYLPAPVLNFFPCGIVVQLAAREQASARGMV